MQLSSDPHVAQAPARSPGRPPAFELKGVMTSLAVMRPNTVDLAAIERQLRVKVASLPQFFQDAPVVLDLGAMPRGGMELPLNPLVALLRDYHLVPVAVTNASDEVRPYAIGEGLGVMPSRAARVPGRPGPMTAARAAAAEAAAAAVVAAAGGGRNPHIESMQEEARALRAQARRESANGKTPGPTPGPTKVDPVAPAAAAPRPSMVIRNPVRSGQVIYAEKSDLVVLGPVNPGAEVLADGHIHLYGALKGRAIAGAQGFAEAQIFCQKLEAELVAVGGAYVLSDDIPMDRRGRPSMIQLVDGECRIVAL